MGMESENARFLRQGMVEKYRGMTPIERLRAFVEHSRLMMDLKKAGDARRKAIAEKATLND